MLCARVDDARKRLRESRVRDATMENRISETLLWSAADGEDEWTFEGKKRDGGEN